MKGHFVTDSNKKIVLFRESVVMLMTVVFKYFLNIKNVFNNIDNSITNVAKGSFYFNGHCLKRTPHLMTTMMIRISWTSFSAQQEKEGVTPMN